MRERGGVGRKGSGEERKGGNKKGEGERGREGEGKGSGRDVKVLKERQLIISCY